MKQDISIQPEQAGIFDYGAEEYHGDPAPEPSLSSTLAKAMIAKSPRHAWLQSPKLNPDFTPTNSKVFDYGRATHRVVLGAGDDYVEIPADILASNGATSTKEAKAFVAQAREEGKTPLKAAEIRDIWYMAEVAERHFRAVGIVLDPKASERAALALDGDVWVRCMVDNAPFDPAAPLFDLKTTQDAHPDAVAKSIQTYGYDLQERHYTRTWQLASGEAKPRDFLFGFQEKTAPFAVSVVRIGEESRAIGAKKAARARAMWSWCLSRAEWPAYPVGIHNIELPGWGAEKWFEAESMADDYRARTGRDILEQSIISQK